MPDDEQVPAEVADGTYLASDSPPAPDAVLEQTVEPVPGSVA